MDTLELVAVFAAAVLGTTLLTPFAREIAIYFGAIDRPSERRVNRIPVARMGGIALFFGIIIALLICLLGVTFFGWMNPLVPHATLRVNYLGVGLGVAVVFAVGIVDDLIDLSPKIKLLGQIIAACIVAASGLLLASIRSPFGNGFIDLGLWAYPITVIYLVAFTNVINLIDGLDGLAAGITAITSFTIFLFSLMTSRPDAAVMSIALCGVCVGFLRYNFHPASIFMGDSGSLLLGMSLGIVSLLAVARSAIVVSLIVPLLAAGVPIVDTALAIIRRKRAHTPIDQADRGHIHHRLLEIGFSQSKTVFIMWAWTAVLSLSAVLIVQMGGIARIVVIIIAFAISGYAIMKLRLFDTVLLHHYNPRERKQEAPNVGGHNRGSAQVKNKKSPR